MWYREQSNIGYSFQRVSTAKSWENRCGENSTYFLWSRKSKHLNARTFLIVNSQCSYGIHCKSSIITVNIKANRTPLHEYGYYIHICVRSYNFEFTINDCYNRFWYVEYIKILSTIPLQCKTINYILFLTVAKGKK